VNSTTTNLLHRLRQARVAMLRAQLAVTGAQILFWVALIGVLLGIGVRALSRRAPVEADAHPATTTASPPDIDGAATSSP
jgi:hypothetical protein